MASLSHFPAFHFPQFILGVVTARLVLFNSQRDEKLCAAIFVFGIVVVLAIALFNAPEWMRSDAVLAPICAAIMWGADGSIVVDGYSLPAAIGDVGPCRATRYTSCTGRCGFGG